MILLLPGNVAVDRQQAITQTIQPVMLPYTFPSSLAELTAQLG